MKKVATKQRKTHLHATILETLQGNEKQYFLRIDTALIKPLSPMHSGKNVCG